MANTLFVDQSTVIVAAWLNDINNTIYNLLGNGTVVPANIATLRTNIGLGTIAVQNANNVTITGGTITGVTFPADSSLTGQVPIANGGTNAATASAARTNLGVVIGTDVQAFDAQLSSLVRQVSQSANYTTILTDGGKHLLHPSADASARTFTIDSNANIAYPIGTALTFINQNAAGVVTIAITTDTMRLAGPGTTGSRTLAANGIATAIKITSTEWIISGVGLT